MIDILLATYNGEKYIDKQIKSLVTQSRDDLDCDLRLIIRDDGSTDSTVDIIRKRLDYYRTRRDNPIEVHIIEDDKNTGSPSANFQKLLQISSADYVMFSDQDDMWYRRKTEVTYKRMKELEQRYGSDIPLMVHTDLALMDENGRKLADSFYDYQKLPREDRLENLIIQNTVTGCTVMLNRAAVDLVKQAPASEMVLMYDHFAAIVVAATGHISFIDEPLIRYRQHSGNSVGAHAADSMDEYKARFDTGRQGFLRDMDLSYRQVGYIVRRYGDSIRAAQGEEVVSLMEQYSNLIMASKTEKLKFFQKFGVYKNGTLKKAVQMLWC